MTNIAKRTRPDPIDIDPRETKLPVWAQEQIATLRRRTRDAEAAAREAALATDPEGSDAYIEHYGIGNAPNVGLGKRPVVVFPVSDGPHPDTISVQVRIVGGVRVVLVASDGGRIAVLPSASNSVHVRSLSS